VITSRNDLLRAPIQWPVGAEHQWVPADLVHELGQRAGIALEAVWGNRVYSWTAREDDSGERLPGQHDYLVHFPAGADVFWSLTLYDAGHHLVDNPIGRYVIGDRLNDLAHNIDDSVDVDVRQMPPGPGKETNWLPSPAGSFELRLRIYLSRADGLAEGSLPLPSIRRT
jgi:hypothetical protein